MMYTWGIVFALGFGVFLLGAFRTPALKEKFKTTLVVTSIINLALFIVSFDGKITYIRHVVVYVLMGLLYISWNSISFRSYKNEIKQLEIEQPEGYLKAIKELEKSRCIIIGGGICILIWIVLMIMSY